MGRSIAYVALMRGLGDLSITIPGKRKLVKAPQALDLPRLKSTKIELVPSVTVNVGEIAGDALERADRYLRARGAWIESHAPVYESGSHLTNTQDCAGALLAENVLPIGMFSNCQ
ncbi:MAG: hypothetical protein EKK29_20370 [Hyphomicrobiales bacterium]|nr:MAG: hypothetical protein EKK29_20370 [Hyphomicrobiales bacterium]